jgi:predicted phage terminase large subunit-like protein
MFSTTQQLVQEDFSSFVRRAFRFDHGEKLTSRAYIDYLCHHLEKIVDGDIRRLIINLPPRHLKTKLAAVYLSAWILAKQPGARIMIITYSGGLAEKITYQIREIMQSDWYQEIFKTRIAKNRSKVDDFATTSGGSVFATSVSGQLAGHGADFIIFDDPLDLKDADNDSQIEYVNQLFDSLIVSRLNNPKTGRIVLIAHRLNANDLSDHLYKQRGWRRVVLPLIATRDKVYEMDGEKWTRKRGELLRPEAFTKKQIKNLQNNTMSPSFDLFYQQDPGGGSRSKIKPTHFQTIDTRGLPLMPVILSIDPGQRGGVSSSYCVIQAWSPFENAHILRDQWREQCGFKQFKKTYWSALRHFNPSVVLIEATANGPALISEVERRTNAQIVEIVPDGSSKEARLLNHMRLIRRGQIWLANSEPWHDEFINELVAFPAGPFDDQVDATTQYLDWITTNPIPSLPKPRGTAGGCYSNGSPILFNAASPGSNLSGIAIARGR